MERHRPRRLLATALAGLCVGYALEPRVSAYCWYGGDCFRNPPGGTCYGMLCGSTPQLDAYYDPECLPSVCCQGFHWCFDMYPPYGDCWMCGSTNESKCDSEPCND